MYPKAIAPIIYIGPKRLDAEGGGETLQVQIRRNPVGPIETLLERPLVFV